MKYSCRVPGLTGEYERVAYRRDWTGAVFPASKQGASIAMNLNGFIPDRRFPLLPALTAVCTMLSVLALIAVPAMAEPDLTSSQAQVDRIQAEVSSINAAAEQAVERYNQANSELEETRRQISENEKALGEASTKLADAQLRLNRRLESIYREGSLGYMDVVLSTSSFNEFLTRFDLLGRIGDQDKSDIDEVLQFKSEKETGPGRSGPDTSETGRIAEFGGRREIRHRITAVRPPGRARQRPGRRGRVAGAAAGSAIPDCLSSTAGRPERRRRRTGVAGRMQDRLQAPTPNRQARPRLRRQSMRQASPCNTWECRMSGEALHRPASTAPDL